MIVARLFQWGINGIEDAKKSGRLTYLRELDFEDINLVKKQYN